MVVHHDDPLPTTTTTTTTKKYIKRILFFVAWYTYNSEAMKDITIKHTDLIHKPSVHSKFKFLRPKLETFPVGGILLCLHMCYTFFSNLLMVADIYFE